MLTTLPTELSLYILRDLSLSDLANLQTVSRDVHSFLKIHEDPVYHNAAVYHRFVPVTSTPDQRGELAPYRVRRRSGNASWKYLCRIWSTTESSWNGRGVVRVVEASFPSLAGNAAVHQIHVDEKRGLLIVNAVKYVQVYSLESGKPVTRLQPSRDIVLHMAVSEDYIAAIESSASEPNPSLNIYTRNEQGAYHHLLEVAPPQDFTITVRDNSIKLVWPLLAVILLQDVTSLRVAVYDARSGNFVRILNPSEHLHPAWYSEHGFTNGSIQLTRNYLLVSLTTCVLIMALGEIDEELDSRRRLIFPSRSMGMDSSAVMMVTAVRALDTQPLGTHPEIWTCQDSPAVYLAGTTAMTQVTLTPPLVTLDVNSTSIVPWSDAMTDQRFTSATLSPSERHFAAVNEYGILYIAADFDRVFRGLQSWEAITTKLAFPPPAMHVIWDHEERLIVKAGGTLYVINLDPIFHRLSHKASTSDPLLALPSFSNLTVHRINHFSDPRNRMLHGSTTRVTPHGIWTVSTKKLWERNVQRMTDLREARVGDDQDEDIQATRDVLFIDFTAGNMSE